MMWYMDINLFYKENAKETPYAVVVIFFPRLSKLPDKKNKSTSWVEYS